MTDETIFDAALQKNGPAERAAYLDAACAGDQALRDQVDALLQAHAQAGAFLLRPAVGITGVHGLDPAAVESPAEAVGNRIGPYRLLQKLGEGGMGAVWEAEQTEAVQRRVALKVIKTGMDSAQIIRRFEIERQALALMDHTNIARVLDASTTAEGRPYFVMELVNGIPLTKYCDQSRLSLRERLELFVPVCQAIQHAHQKGIIHRDLKPSNVLVAVLDGRPIPKVIDFGVAKVLHQPLTDQSLCTEAGQVIGTLEYMSPEQAELSTLDVDTRSDVYSLGVLLYELLTGTTPLDRKRHGHVPAELLRLIREEEPVKPSTRLSESTETAARVAAERRTEPLRLAKDVRGELDWIVMKCLEKDRARRYETASALARDVQCYLADETVEARPASAGYRLGKLLRRNRGTVIAVALVLLAMLGGLFGTTWGLVRAERAWEAESVQRQLAQDRERDAVTAVEEEQKARTSEADQRRLAEANEKRAITEKQMELATRTFLQRDLLRQAIPTEQADAVRLLGSGFVTMENPTVKELLDRAAVELTPAKIEAKFPRQKEAQASILRTVGEAYYGVGEYDRAVEFLKRASDVYGDVSGAESSDTLYALNGLNGLAMAYQASGKLREAVELFEQIRDCQVKKRLGTDDPNRLSNLSNLAEAYLDVGKLRQAVDLLEHVRDVRLKQVGADHSTVIVTLTNLAAAYVAVGKLSQAIDLLEHVRDDRLKEVGADHPVTLNSLNHLAAAYQAAGKLSQAIKLFEHVRDFQSKKLGINHPNTLTTQNNLSAAYVSAGRLPEAIALLEHVRDVMAKKLPPDHPYTLTTLHNLAAAYHSDGRRLQALELFERVRDLKVKKFGGDHPDTISTLNSIAQEYRGLGKVAQSIALYEQTRATALKKLGPDHPLTLAILNGLAGAYREDKKLPQAIELFEQVRDARVRTLGADHQYTLFTLSNLATTYQDAGKLPEATVMFQQVRDAQVKKLGIDHPDTLTTLNNLALVYQQSGKITEAIDLFRQAHALWVKKLGADHPNTFYVANNLAWAYVIAGKPEQALPLLRHAAVQIEKRKFDHTYAERVVRNLIACHETLKQFDQAEVWRRKWVAVVKERFGPQSSQYANELAALGASFLDQKNWTAAEMPLRESLGLCVRYVPDAWTTFRIKSMLGESLAGQKKFADAEPVLLAGYEGMKMREAKIPAASMPALTAALERIVYLYDAWDKKDKAEEWRKKLALPKAKN